MILANSYVALFPYGCKGNLKEKEEKKKTRKTYII